MDVADRRAQAMAEISDRTGITEAMIETLVRGFYDRVRADGLLGPIFQARIADWNHICSACAPSGPRSL